MQRNQMVGCLGTNERGVFMSKTQLLTKNSSIVY